MEHKKEITIGLSIFIVVGLVAYFYFSRLLPIPAEQAPVVSIIAPEVAVISEPARTDFGNVLPTDFPTNIPVEQGAKVSQSYSLDYVGQKQLTIVFPSTKTIKQNYTLYADFLKTDGWNVSNKYESENVSSLGALKENSGINVTITKGQVSISVLKK